MLTGGCYCAAIRYEVDGHPYDETVCHCSICRRCAGAPCVGWFTIARARFRFITGAPARFRSSAEATRTFCNRCGTPLTFEHDARPAEIDLTMCSLDEPEAVPPRDHTYTGSQLGWLKLADELPRYAKARPGT
jgi:hypothetical protein